MKRKALIFTLSLVMCLLMAFPASAALYPEITVSTYSYQEFYNYIYSQSGINDYPYVAFFHQANNGKLAILSKDKVLVKGSTILIYYGNGATGGWVSNGASRIFDSVTYSGSNLSINLNNVSYSVSYFFPELSTIEITSIPTTYLRSLTNVTPLPDISALQSLLAQAKAKQNTGYTQSTWNALQSQIAAVENLLASTGYTQSQVDSAKNALQAALNGLLLLPDTSDLAALLSQADVIEDIGYTGESWTRFINARIAAHALLLSGDYTQSHYNAVYAELLASMNGLTLQVVTPPEPPDPPSASLGYDLRTGDISGYLNVVPKISYVYIDTMKPIFLGLFGIVICILIIPRILSVIIPHLRR